MIRTNYQIREYRTVKEILFNSVNTIQVKFEFDAFFMLVLLKTCISYPDPASYRERTNRLIQEDVKEP